MSNLEEVLERLQNIDADKLSKLLDLVDASDNDRPIASKETKTKRKVKKKRPKRNKQRLKTNVGEDIDMEAADAPPSQFPEQHAPAPVKINKPKRQRRGGGGRRNRNNDEFNLDRHRKQRGGGRNSKGVPSHISNMDTTGGRENLFLKMKDFNAHRDDVEKDKILTGKNLPVPRREEMSFVEVECIECGTSEMVSPKIVYGDPVSGQIRYRCNNCIPIGER